ncbi:TRF5 [Candida pseudojiufengensis]|uniref:TRF5 n=1 Tax=Candida pseudojiufengensis TaxID=497109 RepID=UPI002224A429|nr:TRF5 [Candida pseudojiufengensis]KAI5966199.1 TRF5 [Candida pseudojiufengensis]
MGSKRKRDNKESNRLPKQKKQKINSKNSLPNPNKKFNSYENLNSEDNSDSEYVYDYNNNDEIDDYSDNDGFHLIDSEDEDEIENSPGYITNEKDYDEIEDFENNEDINDDYDPTEFIPKDKPKEESNEVTKNQDFIGFGFSSSSEEEDEENISDQNEYNDGPMDSTPKANYGPNNNTPHSTYAWIKNHDHSTQKEIADWLTLEIKDFVNYISPHKSEIIMRNKIINNLKTQISKFWPGTETHVFGSCATDLYLPGSDIDLVIISDTGDYENRSRLYQLSSFLKAKKLADKVEVIASAKVPIIKFVDPLSNLNIDISFERKNGIDAAKRIRKWLNSTPGLRELVLVIKQFLRSRKLNNVHVGGLGGYATIIMCYHFIKLHPKIATNSMNALDNLGVLLIEFFELYGRNFSYDNLIIALDKKTDLPKYLIKGKKYSNLNTSRNTFSIVIQDPADPLNNITRSSYNLRDLKKAFGGAFQLLISKCYELNSASYKKRLNQSILGDIIKFKGKQRDFNDDRNIIVNDALINDDDESQEVEEEDDEEDYDPEANLNIGNSKYKSINDKYYFSDMTIESDDEEKDDEDENDENDEYKPKVVKLKSNSNSKSLPKSRSITPTPITNKSKDTKKLVESFLSLEKDENDIEDGNDEGENENKNQENNNNLPKKPNLSNLPKKPNLDKDIKRDFWRQKGLDM